VNLQRSLCKAKYECLTDRAKYCKGKVKRDLRQLSEIAMKLGCIPGIKILDKKLLIFLLMNELVIFRKRLD